MKLYSANGSPNCRKVLAVINYLKLDVEITVLDILHGEHKTPDYLAINPNGKVPSLVDGNYKLWESNAIMQYLAAQTESSLFPEDTASRFDIIKWQFWESVHYGDAVGSILWENFAKSAFGLGEKDAVQLKRAIDKFHQFAPVLEAQLHNNNFVCGDKVTLADFSLACHGAYLEKAKVPLEKYPNIKSWYGRLDTVVAWADSAPPPNIMRNF